MTKIYDTKEQWIKYRKNLHLKLPHSDKLIPELEVRIRIQKNTEGLFETPKTYTDGVAYNDGSWLIYNTCRTTKCKVRTKIKCNTKNDIIKKLISYLFFLKEVGITNKYEMLYYAIYFISDRLFYTKGMFDCNDNNKVLIGKKISYVLNRKGSCSCSRFDDRKFCFDPKLKNSFKSYGKLNRKLYTKEQKRIVKESKDELIRKYYNSELSIRENVKVMKENGIEVSKSSLGRWLKSTVPYDPQN